jgi:hypothetical protein
MQPLYCLKLFQIHSKYKFGIRDSNGQFTSHTTTHNDTDIVAEVIRARTDIGEMIKHMLIGEVIKHMQKSPMDVSIR